MGFDTRQGQVSGRVAERWETSATVAAATNWFTNDIEPFINSRKEFAIEDKETVVKHTLEIFVPTDTVVNIQKTFLGVTKVLNLNGGNALTGGAAFQFDLMLQTGMTYNIQHATGTLNVAVLITESYNTDI